MGLIKLALIGGAAYYAGKKFNEPHNGNGYPNQTDNNNNNNNWGHGWGGRCQRKRQQQQQQQQQPAMAREVDDGNNNVYSDYPSEKKQQPIATATEQQQQQYDYPPYNYGASQPTQPGYYWYGPSPHSHPVSGYTATRDQKTPLPQSASKEMVKIEGATTPSPVDNNDAVPVNAAHLPPYTTGNSASRGLSPRQRMYPFPYDKEPMI